MASTPEESREMSHKGAGRLGLGAWVGLFAAIFAIVLPSIALFLSAYNPGGAFPFAADALASTGAFVLAGAVLYILSLFIYRRAFSALKRVDRDFGLASLLCWVGSVGFVLILVGAVVVTGSASSVVGCIKGAPSHLLTCLEANQPLGAYTAIVGFILAWLGGLGIVLGLWQAGGYFEERAVDLGALVYLFFLLVILAPFVELAVAFPGSQYLLVIVPILSVAAPALVLLGILPDIRTERATAAAA